MRQIQNGITENKEELALYRSAPKFVPAGQSTQMIIGATPENDYQIMSVAEQLYDKFSLKRVFYSAFINVNEDSNLPMLARWTASFEGTPSLSGRLAVALLPFSCR